MRHNFVNDIGDYAKYALLRAICSSSPAGTRLGVLWYLTEHVEINGDGRRRPHLLRDGWEDLDSQLLEWMRELDRSLDGGAPHLSLIERSGILPPQTAYFSAALPHGGRTSAERLRQRSEWFQRARDSMRGCDFIFLDPDNGLEVRSVLPGSRMAGKYASIQEVSALLDTGAGVILYQHGDRSPWSAQRSKICQRIASTRERPPIIRSLRFGAFGVRAFFCVSDRPDQARVFDAALDLLRRRVLAWDKAHYLSFE